MPAELFTEEALIAGCQRGDRLVQEAVYRRYAEDFTRICLRYAACKPDADQMLNEAFFKIFTRIDQFEHSGPFAAWMRRIVVHTCLDAVKEKMRRHSRESFQATEALPETTETTIADAVSLLNYRELLQLVQALPEKQRLIFNLSVFEQLTHKEIGALLGIASGTSQWYLAQARESLKTQLSKFHDHYA